MGDDVNRVEILAPGQRVADLLDAVAIGVEGHDLERATGVALRVQVVDELLVVRGTDVDEHDLAPIGLRGDLGDRAGLIAVTGVDLEDPGVERNTVVRVPEREYYRAFFRSNP